MSLAFPSLGTEDPIDGQTVQEPMVRRTVITCFRQSAEMTLGRDALRHIGDSMSDEGRSACITPVIISQPFLPERYVVEWMSAAHRVAGSREVYYEHLSQMMTLGFGRVRRFLLSFASPYTLSEKASDLWRHDHTHGDLKVVEKDDESITMRLSDHPYLSTPNSRESIAECLRCALELTKVTGVRNDFSFDGNALDMRFTWGAQ